MKVLLGISCLFIGAAALLYARGISLDRVPGSMFEDPGGRAGTPAFDNAVTVVNSGDTITDPDLDPLAPEQSIALDTCIIAQECIDEYLWSVYARTTKMDTIKVQEQINVAVKRKGKRRVITKTMTKLVDEDFTWKDPQAASKAGMSLPNYVIGGMDREFRLKLYRLLRALDDVGLAPGITSGFRDDYRQSIASGNKAATSSSYHGGTRRGGYGFGLAADLVSVKGDSRGERAISSETLWKWIDEHSNEFGIGRPYLDRDPPHVGPTDGKEYTEKRRLKVQRAGL